ncbi:MULTISPECIES: 50S ribosomal protein L29 [Dyadobacter]|jgi:large subunit ribosomal protein L29|uniref:Large ribosomal subunit protein uL29 n=6 Tax=Dyadobacter TaxID=120831 RepID=C6W1X8_DYAFD|nr:MULTISPECIES: 50S ribosomal protein L29 [Dyadobacter]MBE8971430.1 50S ribosomal protein L29 [Nostocales cyanobacterium LEGE 12452]ACT95553.1 ribosomal protein L29 [Dyadobacter fermentans DSM 18053]MBO9615291.1 50S ribosomal protein L29 [Dyadobacter sp.]MBZ1358632.1 50S ribosomal protein L29 [Dyadobacter fermentans]MDR6803307.1 large subunit ribosomal protein L29 [Dyadobacter fermentans]
MTSKEIKNLSQDQLKEQIAQERERLLRLKFAHAISPIENPLRIRASRKEIARLLTELSAKSNQQ